MQAAAKTAPKREILRRLLLQVSRLPRAITFNNLNKPLPVAFLSGVALLCLSNHIQDRYWRSQQEFLFTQAELNRKVELATSSEDELVRNVGKLLAASGGLTAAHELQFDNDALTKTVEQYNQLQSQWDESDSMIKLKLHLYFNEQRLQSGWTDVSNTLEELDNAVHNLEHFHTTDSSKAHRQQIQKCREVMERTEHQLLDLTLAMSNYTDQLRHNRK